MGYIYRNWNYVEKDGQPKKDGEYLVSIWLVDSSDCPKRYTAYAYWDSEVHEWSNGEGYEYDVYAWTEVIDPIEPLGEKEWREFFIKEESTWTIVREYCRKNKYKFEFETPFVESHLDDYARVQILCTLPEEEKIKQLIEIFCE